MIILCAGNESQYYSLEQFHNFLGIITKEEVLFCVGDDNITDVGKMRIVFSERFGKEAVIYGNTLYVDGEVLSFINSTLNRTEEAYCKKDKIGRMPLTESSAYSQNVHRTPYLESFLNGLREKVKEFLTLRAISWECVNPNKQPIVCITHDIDSICGKSLIRYAFWLLKAFIRCSPSEFTKAIKRICAFEDYSTDPHFSFDEYRIFEESFGFKSTFFVLSLPFFIGGERRRYTLRTKNLYKKLQELCMLGWEVGLHPSRATHLNQRLLVKEYNRFTVILGECAKNGGVRNHYLLASFPKTWQLQETLGFRYDSTMGWTQSPGFRAGTSRPYQPFNTLTSKRFSLWELPLIVMDGSIKGTSDEIVAECVTLAEECFRYGSPFTLLWHTDRLNPIDYPEHAKAYHKLLEYFSKRGCIGTTAGQVIDIYENYTKEMSAHRQRITNKTFMTNVKIY